MFTQKNQWHKKAGAALLLCLMLFINGVQLLHRHAASTDAPKEKIKTETGFSTHSTDTKCTICEYQLTREADNSFTVFTITPFVAGIIQNPFLQPASKFCFRQNSSNRGPPAYC